MRSIFSKILVFGLGTALFTTAALSIFLSGLFSDYFTYKYEIQQDKAVREVKELTERYIRGQLAIARYNQEIQIIDRLEKTHFCILDLNNRLLFATDPDIAGAPSDEMLQHLAKETKKNGKTTMMLNDPDNSSLDLLVTSIAIPKLTIIAFTLIEDIHGPIRNLIHLVWFAAMGAFAISIIPTYLISRYFTSPFTKMNQAALKMGQGDFSARINISRTDEIGRLAQTLDYMAIQLEALERTRQDFLANVSHELRTPLTSIRGFAQGMLDGTVPLTKHPTYLARIYAESERLAEIVDDLLTLARLRSGHLQFNWTDVVPGTVLSEVVEICRPIAAEKNVGLILSGTSSEKTIQADPQRLTEVFINIIDNAIKFSPPDSTVYVQSGWTPTEFWVKFADEGAGIPADELPNIFDRFYIGNPSSRQEYAGTGLGLAISKLLIENHGGNITVHNRGPRGCEFTIKLPLKNTANAV